MQCTQFAIIMSSGLEALSVADGLSVCLSLYYTGFLLPPDTAKLKIAKTPLFVGMFWVTPADDGQSVNG